LWGDRPDELARQNLRQCLVSLRRDLAQTFADLLNLDDDLVALNPENLRVDARDFALLGNSSAPGALEQAAELYGGPFLANFGVQVESFQEWVRTERSRLEATASRIFVACAERADVAGHGEKAVKLIERLTALEPLREDWQRLALRLYARYHGRDAAIVQADRFVALLKRELDVDVEPATSALIDEIRRGAVVPAPVAEMTVDAADSVTDVEVAGRTVGGKADKGRKQIFTPAPPSLRQIRSMSSRSSRNSGMLPQRLLWWRPFFSSPVPGSSPRSSRLRRSALATSRSDQGLNIWRAIRRGTCRFRD